jgi:peroxiredoxin
MNATMPPLSPLSAGERAPDFSLSAIDGTGTISLADYRGKSPVFLALFVGLWCPFCRRSIAQMSAIEPALKEVGVESVAVVATRPENARLYFRYRPTRLRLAADPELSTHRAFGVPKPQATPQLMAELGTTKINPDGIFPRPLPIPDAVETITKMDNYAGTAADQTDMEKQWPQLKGQFLIDRDSTIRWSNIECGNEGLSGIGKFPSRDEILSAARMVT